MLLRGEQDALHKQTSLRTAAASERWRAHRSGHTSGSISSPLSLPGSLKSEAAAVPRHPGQSGHQIISTLPSAQHLYPEFKPHEARSKISEAREEKELPAALQQIPAPHGLTARLQPSSLQAPISPPGTLQLLSAGGLQRIHELLGSVQLRQEKRDFSPKPARTGQAVSSLKQPQQQEVKQLSSWKEKM